MAVVSHRREEDLPLIGALRHFVTLSCSSCSLSCSHSLASRSWATGSWPIGFDFRGTLWAPARAFLDGNPIYPEPTRDAVALGNPTVYPPLVILLRDAVRAAPRRLAVVALVRPPCRVCVASMRILGVRDWRCLVLAVTTPVVVPRALYGERHVLLLVPLALGVALRDRAAIAGVSVGLAIAAKLFVAPLVVWLLLTRRFRAAAWALGSSRAS